MAANIGIRSAPPRFLLSRPNPKTHATSLRPSIWRRRSFCCLGGGDRNPGREKKPVRTLLVDNYDSYTYNIYQELSVVNGVPPVVVQNDEWTMEEVKFYLYEDKAFDNIVISPGPGSPANPKDIGICLEILLDCADVPILGICLGHQALGIVHGAQIVHAPEPVHGRLSEIDHNGCSLFNNIPSGINSGFKVVRYHSLVIDADSLPKELIPVAWTTIIRPGLSDINGFNGLKRKVLMGVMHCARPHFGVQFHPESIATGHGRQIFENFKKTTVDYVSRSSMLQERKVSHACQSFEGPPSSKLLRCKAAKGHHFNLCKNPQLTLRSSDVKPLRLQWIKIDSLISRFCGSEDIFYHLFGDKDAENTFWLDSSSTDKDRARFSFMGAKGGSLWKQLTFRLEDGSKHTGAGGYLSILDNHGFTRNMFLNDGLFDFLNKELQSFHYDKEDYEGLPFDFCGGFIGFMGYNLKVECGAVSNRYKSTTPDACFFFADKLVVVDHSNGDVYALSIHNVYHSDNKISEVDNSREHLWLDEMEKKLLRLKATAPKKLKLKKSLAGSSISTKGGFIVEKSRQHYIEDVEKCLKLIRDGESYELCLTTQMKRRLEGVNALELYINLRNHNPAPYAAWLNFAKEKLCICCSSPERFLRLDGIGQLEAKPIKGTIARGRTPAEDEHLRLQLQSSEKNQAENLMIVDLLRNDLGRVCEPGSVSVPLLMDVESYATVHTMVSTVQGKKKSNVGPIDCLRAAFPGGSMTGAPKLRSMELLDSLESSARGIYSGSIGFLSYNQTFDLNIVIRTVVIHEGEATVGAGGAIISLSDPEEEYDEMMLKAKAPTRAVNEYITDMDYSRRTFKMAM